MSKILHISDLHLGPPEEWQLLDDHKSLIAGGDRRAQKDVLNDTLASLKDAGVLDELDAAVVTGDLTNKACSEGFQEFTSFIAPLVDRLGPEKILVVPGNHDVPWEPGPNDPNRYQEFLEVTRAQGMATPLLDGIDFPNRDPDPPHLLSGDDFVVVPVNSSHFCWGMEPLDPTLVDELFTVASDKLADAVDALRRHDVARVSNRQIDALLDFLKEEDPLVVGEDLDPRVRIAALHHQLLPVTPNEEFKSFETLSNLGSIRELFARMRIRVVLHGHKHADNLFWDYVARGSVNRSAHRMLVCAAPGEFLPGRPAMRLLTIGERIQARDIYVEDLLAPHRGENLRRTPHYVRLWRSTDVDRVGDAMAIHGQSVSEVYAKVQSLFQGRRSDEPLHDLVCEITDPEDAGTLPLDFPKPETINDVQAWMNDLVEWWQLRDPQLLHYVTFNHGERIYRRWGDQTERAVETLRKSFRGGTTRAVIMLFDPWTDGQPDGEFLSFVLMQLQLVEREGAVELDCTGYFRKQEMRYWWPINVAELAKVQEDVVEQLSSGEHRIQKGRLRTVTAYAALEEKLPAVALAAIDRAIDQHPKDLWMMANGLLQTEDGGRIGLLALWEHYLGELDPADYEPSGVLPISYRGLGDVAKIVTWLGLGEEPIGKALDDLVDLYRSLHEQGRFVRANQETVKLIRRKLAGIRAALNERLSVDDG